MPKRVGAAPTLVYPESDGEPIGRKWKTCQIAFGYDRCDRPVFSGHSRYTCLWQHVYLL